MTSLVTHRLTMALGIISNVHNSSIPDYVRFRNYSDSPVPMPHNTYRIGYDTGIEALDCLLTYWRNVPYAKHYHVSVMHALVARMAEAAISSHGWAQATSDAITVTWMATVGKEAFIIKNGVAPSARMQFYNKGLEDGFIYNCSEWKEFL